MDILVGFIIKFPKYQQDIPVLKKLHPPHDFHALGVEAAMATCTGGRRTGASGKHVI